MKRLVEILVAILFLSLGSYAHGQSLTEGVAISISMPEGENAQDGDIVSSSDKGFTITKTAYDPLLYAVIADNPAVILDNNAIAGKEFILTNGKAYVRVSTKNGPIKKGDFITSSEIPGVGQKADKGGYVLGLALEDFTSNNSQDIGKILVSIDIRFQSLQNARTNLIETVKLAVEAPFLTPLGAMRYLLASLIAVGSFVLAFISFGKVARGGVEALGRNPLASKVIEVTVIINVLLTIAILLVGLGIAYLILVL